MKKLLPLIIMLVTDLAAYAETTTAVSSPDGKTSSLKATRDGHVKLVVKPEDGIVIVAN